MEPLRLRSSRNYRLVIADRLSQRQKQELGGLLTSSEIYGVLVPRGRVAGSPKVIYGDTALLWFTLRTPGTVPAYLKERMGARCDAVLERLILDDVLEVASEGRFTSGPAAAAALRDRGAEQLGKGRLEQLSIAALKYAQHLDLSDVRKLAARLYFYNRIPLTPQWLSLLGTDAAVVTYLGLAHGSRASRLLDAEWVSLGAGKSESGWRYWRSRRGEHIKSTSGATYKVYLSPVPPAAAEALEVFLVAAAAVGVPQFKVGYDAYGLLRPDKFVAYVNDLEEVYRLGEALRARLAGCSAQGVPFSAAIGDDGLVSWGIDPPSEPTLLQWEGPESWRLWLTKRLANALVAAQSTPGLGLEPWEFALARIRLDGVDPHTWARDPVAWADESDQVG